MKKIVITICLFIGFISFSKAQGNLQFNKAKFIELEGMQYNFAPFNYYRGVDSVTITIPANKVWKIEKVQAVGVDSLTGYYDENIHGLLYITVNDVAISEPAGYPQQTGILWLPAGTYKLRLMARIGINGQGKFKGFISAIEYNIVP